MSLPRFYSDTLTNHLKKVRLILRLKARRETLVQKRNNFIPLVTVRCKVQSS